MRKSKFTEDQIAFALKHNELGTSVDEVCRKMGISEATFYVWKKKYSGIGPSELRRLRQFEEPCRASGAPNGAGRGIAMLTSKPVLHGDNGSTLKATTVLAMLNWLGVKPSYSRPRVSDDNAYAESLLRTAKYRPEFPAWGFTDLDAARAWAAGFVHRYNVEHRHSGIRYVSPAQRHVGEDKDILDACHALYSRARE